jgi:hypothetical protein
LEKAGERIGDLFLGLKASIYGQPLAYLIWVMSSSKATDEEGFQAEFFKHGLRALVSYLADLFNHVVRTGSPSTWSHHIIHSIHKSGPNTDPNNYRTIMVGHTFSKLYAMVLHMKLSCDLE